MKVEKNELCWCGSGKKYKRCHLEIDERLKLLNRQGHRIPNREMLKSQEQINGIREAGKRNTEVLDMIEEYVKEGVSTEELNQRVHEFTVLHGGIPATLGYRGYPKSVCISINEVVCHGIPNENIILKDGDIVNIDTTTIVNGYYGDASRMYGIGNVSPEKQRLIAAAKECLERGFAEAKPWGFLGDIGYAISSYACENGYSIVREIGGHGVGIEFHEEPWVSHIGQRGTDIALTPGMIFTIEPMVNMGKPDVYVDDEDGWTVRTEDGQPSAQWEYTILITSAGAEILSF